jgi:hypothetical protein
VVVPEVDRATRQKYDVPEDRRIFGYIAGQFLIVAFVVFALLWFKTTLPTAVVLAAGGVVLAALGSWSGLLERKRWATPLETVRLLALIALSLSIASSFGWAVAIALGAAAVVSLAALVRLPRAVSSVAA